MSQLLATLAGHARTRGQAIALRDDHDTCSYGQLWARINTLAAQLKTLDARVVALHADNSIDWLVADLAILSAGLVCIPLPPFFTQEQCSYACDNAGVDLLLTQWPALWELTDSRTLAGTTLHAFKKNVAAVPLHENSCKITFTSGSTGTPKGVCLGAEHLDKVTTALQQQVIHPLQIGSHLCLLPLGVLLENIAGAQAALLAGIEVCVPSLGSVGLRGSSAFDPGICVNALQRWQPHSIILLPQMLAALTRQAIRPESLRFAAVGGSHVPSTLLASARQLGIPAYEGYGLSECGSVVALNTPGHDRLGSTGIPLPHLQLRIAEDGEIMVRGPHFLGYLGQPTDASAWLATGDLGRLDAQGFLFLSGRKKNLLISSFGRNISPEWPESLLQEHPCMQQVIVVGDQRPYCAVLVHAPSASDQEINALLTTCNTRLPDYAQLRAWQRLPESLSVANGLLTQNGRPRREQIAHTHASLIDACYA